MKGSIASFLVVGTILGLELILLSRQPLENKMQKVNHRNEITRPSNAHVDRSLVDCSSYGLNELSWQ